MSTSTTESLSAHSEQATKGTAVEQGAARPVQVHIIVAGPADGARARSVWQALAEPNGDFATISGANGNGNGAAHGNGNGAGPGHRYEFVQLPWQEHDLRGLGTSEVRGWINAFLETDSNQRISADRTPAMRFAMAQIDEHASELVWSFHPALQKRIDINRLVEQFAKKFGADARIEKILRDGRVETRVGNDIGAPQKSPDLDENKDTALVQDEIEEKLTSVWESVLEVSPVQPDDDFFDKGGHSLLAARLLARIEDAMGVELPLASLLLAPTIRQQAQVVREHLAKTKEEISPVNDSEVGSQMSSTAEAASASDFVNGSAEHSVPYSLDTFTTERALAGDEIETKLVSVWEAVLKVKPIGLDDDFFDVGGHSVLAARLLARIEDSLGLELPLASLLEASTIRAQAQLVRGYLGKTNGELPAVEQRARESRIIAQLPFFFLGGDPTFRPLWQRLSELREVHNLGLQASIISKLKNPYSLECMAEHFVEAIRERCSEGPYMLGGWCAHGLLAYETARQLRQQGQEVALVVMLETRHPVRMNQGNRWMQMAARAQLKLHLLKFEYAYMRQLDGTQARDYLAVRAARKLTRMKDSFRQALKLTDPDSNGEIIPDNPVDVLYTAAGRYQPKPYDSRVVLVRSLQRTVGFGRQLDLGWGDLLGANLEICESPGNHYTLYMYPNVDALAHKINVCLRRAEERATQAVAAISAN